MAVKLRFAYLEQFVEGDFFRYTLAQNIPLLKLIFAKGFKGVMNSAYDYYKIGASVKDYMKISPYGIFFL